MTPDRKAAIGVLVSPLGNHPVSDAYLQAVADRLIAQEDRTLLGKFYERRIVIHGVPYRLAIATLDQGGEVQAKSWMIVLVAARHWRIYAFAGLAFDRVVHFQVNSSGGIRLPAHRHPDHRAVRPC